MLLLTKLLYKEVLTTLNTTEAVHVASKSVPIVSQLGYILTATSYTVSIFLM